MLKSFAVFIVGIMNVIISWYQVLD
jgi:hypothetical protein